ncbi:MAG: hypothetical protein N2246_06155, partial [Candidatus Sumerlaeia bacterium]|nr:hypothetical protein [Candidatus Sumerlaeia bacterium]
MELLPAQQKIVDEVNQRIEVPWFLQEINYYPDKVQTVMETVKAFCPLHKETRFRSLIIDIVKKSYRCTLRTCPGYEGGKLIDLFARLQNLSQLRAALVLAQKLNIN